MKWMTCAQIVSLTALLATSAAFADEDDLEEGGPHSGMSESIESVDNVGEDPPPFNLSYFGVLYGPSVKNPSSYQPDSSGTPDPNRPILLRNLVTISRDLSDYVTVSGTGAWAWKPVLGQDLQLQDPFVRISHNSLFNSGGLNLYADVRGHFPITTASRQLDLRFGLQFFQALTYTPPSSRFLFALYFSERGNFFGKSGLGNDLELYFAPSMNYQISRTLSFTLMYEFQRSHFIGEPSFPFYSDGTSLEPGINWDITPKISINPYLMIQTEKKLSLNSTSIGMMMNVAIL